jgi:hypothetical protein
MKSLRRTLVFLACHAALWAQRGDTLYQKAITDSTASPVISGNIRTIGQPFHLAYAVFSDAPGQTCSSLNQTGNLEAPSLDIVASYNNVNSVVITNNVRILNPGSGVANDRFRMLATASGAFPYVQVQVGAYNNTNCRVNVWYSGSIVDLDVKKPPVYSGTFDNLRWSAFNTSSSGDNDLVSALSNARITVYGFYLYNTTAQTLQLKDVKSDATVNPLAYLTTFCTGCSQSLPVTGFPYWRSSLGGKVALNLGAATAVSGFIVYRYE